MGGHGCVSDERRLLAGIEEPQADVVIAGGGGGYEGHLRLREFTCNRHHGGIGLAVGVEHDGSRITGETSASERIDLEYAQMSSAASGVSFARIGAPGYTSMNLGVVSNET